jgi:hypothetical protein
MRRHSVAAALGLTIAVLLTCLALLAPNRREIASLRSTMAALDGDNEYNRAAPGGIVHSVHPSFSSPRAPSSGAFVDRVIETKAMSEDAAPFGLPFEHYFLILSRIDYGPLNDFLSADAFAENIAEIERQASQDADASDLAQAYREAATLALRRNAAPLQITPNSWRKERSTQVSGRSPSTRGREHPRFDSSSMSMDFLKWTVTADRVSGLVSRVKPPIRYEC